MNLDAALEPNKGRMRWKTFDGALSPGIQMGAASCETWSKLFVPHAALSGFSM